MNCWNWLVVDPVGIVVIRLDLGHSSNCLFYSFYGVGILTLNSLEEHLPSGVVFTYSEQKLIGHDTVAHSVGRAASDRGSVVSVVANVFFSEQLG